MICSKFDTLIDICKKGDLNTIISNFDLLELPLNINIFEKYFTHIFFGQNLTLWPLVLVKNLKLDFKCHPNIDDYL